MSMDASTVKFMQYLMQQINGCMPKGVEFTLILEDRRCDAAEHLEIGHLYCMSSVSPNETHNQLTAVKAQLGLQSPALNECFAKAKAAMMEDEEDEPRN